MNHSPLHSKRAAFAPTDFLLSLFKATLLATAASKPAAVTGGAGMATCLCSQHKHPICLKWHRVRSGLVLMPGDSPFLFSHLPAGTLSKQQKFLTLVLFLSTKPHKSLKRKTHTHTNMRTQVPKFLQKDLMSVCFGFQGGMHALCGTRGHFPTEESTLKAEGPRVTTALTFMKYYHIVKEREKITLKNENQVHIDSLDKSLLLMMLCQYITFIGTA